MPVIPLYIDSCCGPIQSKQTHSSFFAPEFATEPSVAKENVVNLGVVATNINKCVPKAMPEERYEEKVVGR
jgi:hypothetical protein